MPLHRPWLFSSAGRLRKKSFTQARQTHCVCLTPPFFALYLVAQKCGGQTLRLTGGFAPKTKHVHWGSLAIAGACHFVSAPPVFPFFAGRSSGEKQKAYRPRFTRLVKLLLATKTSL
ncbi:hypothetical protein AB6G26_22820 [Providencia hangzhouensis]|uniref:hypothetical protein n=1 Tax=Providencia hangzhouensis TaxID=3031799 RepID=UPI0034DCD364